MTTPTFPSAALLEWYASARRALPWRDRPDPYSVWLSEIMAQQTRIDTMLAWHARFLERWPTVQDLAAASLDEVLAAWSGLGYYSRARNLHAAAQVVAARGGFPEDAEGLRALPGVGPYTAAAIASVAFNQDVALVDGNVERVLCRWHLVREDPRGGPARARLLALAREALPEGRAGDYNQALMELGALVCTPRGPRCGACPVAEGCGARREGLAEALPHKPRKGRVPEVSASCAAIWRQGRLLMARRPDKGLLGGLWELPGDEHPPDVDEALALTEALARRLGLHARPARRLGEVRHVFTHRKLRLSVWLAEVDGVELRPEGYADARWVHPHDLDEMGISTLTRRCLALLEPGAQRELFAAEPL